MALERASSGGASGNFEIRGAVIALARNLRIVSVRSANDRLPWSDRNGLAVVFQT